MMLIRNAVSVRIKNFGLGVIQTASITGRTTRGGSLRLPKPFPYEEKKIPWFRQLYDDTMINLNQENAKIIVVEGPVAVGKTAFCKVLAEEFDMHYIPQTTMDDYYLLPSGYDLRELDDQFPESIRSYDHKNFCLDPKSVKAGRFQINMMHLRFNQYMNALCHLLNTGQGVVLERSYMSDYVFTKAMLEHKYISRPVAEAYMTIRKNTSTFFMDPHLVIYLDIPVPVVQERIRTRNYCHEQNSPALTKGYLESLEKYYKQDYLKKARFTSEVLIYDWTDGGEVDVVIDDIEKIDFDIMRRDLRFRQWWITRSNLFLLRYTVTNNPGHYFNYFQFPYCRVDDLYIPYEEEMVRDRLLARIPECQFDKGYNYKTGDSILNILFNTKVENHRHPKYHLVYSTFLGDEEDNK